MKNKTKRKNNSKKGKANVEITTEGTVAIVALNDPSITDAEIITGIHENICQFIDKEAPKKIVIDFAQVRFFSSQLLGMLLGVRGKLNEYGAEFVISAIEPRLHRIFKITNLDKIFAFYPDRQAALGTGSEV